MALLTLTILSLIAGSVLLTVTTRYNYSQKAIGWQESLFAAEAGIDFGFANCREMVVSGSIGAWTNTGTTAYWTLYSGSNQLSVTGQAGSTTTTSDAVSSLLLTGTTTNNGVTMTTGTMIYNAPVTALLETGTTGALTEGTNDLWYHIEIDAPANMVLNGNPWYRLRATGYAALPGLARANNDATYGVATHNDVLRKLDLLYDHFIARYGDYAHSAGTLVAVTTPRAARRLEVIASPKTPFVGLKLTGTGITPYSSPILDSWNSSTSGTMGGAYASYKNTNDANLYLNGPAINTGAGVVDGGVYTNGGSVSHANSTITGTINNSTVTQTDPVSAPSGASSWPILFISPDSKNPTTITSTAATSHYQISSYGYPLIISGTTGEVDLYVTSDVGGNPYKGAISVAQGVTVKIWFTGDWDMKAANITNLNNNAKYLQLYGLGTSSATPTFNMDSGNPGTVYMAIYAPGYIYSVSGNPDLAGAFTFKTLSGNGNTTWHYDEALSSVGVVYDFAKVSWVEDTR